MTAIEEFVQILDELDVFLLELAWRDSAPVPARVPRPLREQAERNQRLRERARTLVQRVDELCPTAPEELERLKAELDRQVAEWKAKQEALDNCPHDYLTLEGGIDQCKRCGIWRPTGSRDDFPDEG